MNFMFLRHRCQRHDMMGRIVGKSSGLGTLPLVCFCGVCGEFTPPRGGHSVSWNIRVISKHRKAPDIGGFKYKRGHLPLPCKMEAKYPQNRSPRRSRMGQYQFRMEGLGFFVPPIYTLNIPQLVVYRKHTTSEEQKHL